MSTISYCMICVLLAVAMYNSHVAAQDRERMREDDPSLAPDRDGRAQQVRRSGRYVAKLPDPITVAVFDSFVVSFREAGPSDDSVLTDDAVAEAWAAYQREMAEFSQSDAMTRMRRLSEEAFALRQQPRGGGEAFKAAYTAWREQRADVFDRIVAIDDALFSVFRHHIQRPKQALVIRDHKLERSRRRYLTLAGVLPGDDVDLIHLLGKVAADSIADGSHAELLLSDYRRDHERALAALYEANDAFITYSNTRLVDMYGDNADGGQVIQEIADRKQPVRQASQRVRRVNSRLIDALAEVLPIDVVRRIRAAYRERVCPAYFPDRANLTTFLDEVAALDELTDEQRSTVDGLRVAYREQIERVNRELIELHVEYVADAGFPDRLTPQQHAERVETLRERLERRQAISRETFDAVVTTLDDVSLAALESVMTEIKAALRDDPPAVRSFGPTNIRRRD